MPDTSGNMKKQHFIIGLTGSSGSGKSAAADVLESFGAIVIDADKVAYEVAERRETLEELAGAFGGWITEGGKFNRAQASKKAFSDKAFLARLTEITHKYIIKEIYARVESIQNNNEKTVIVIDAPIPVEKGFLDLADAVWVVSSPRGERLERVMRRDGISAAAAGARFSSQLPDAEYEKLADDVIDNSRGVDELRLVLRSMYDGIKRRHGI